MLLYFRELPQLSRDHWKPYFAKTFDVFTKLWRFQQVHRRILEHHISLRRWQIGEIASRIGQLYYHYYLRTSEANYLQEAFTFYSAIRSRKYFSMLQQHSSSSSTKESHFVPDDFSEHSLQNLTLKILRYYARFIVVSLMLDNMHMVRELATANLYWPAREKVGSYRLGSSRSLLVTPTKYSYRLQEAVIVGCSFDQVKFGEVTIDMCRVAQSLEHEFSLNLHAEFQHSASIMLKSDIISSIDIQRKNPHKTLLYKPTFGAIYSTLSNSFRELRSSNVMLMYFSCDRVCYSKDKHISIFTGDGLRTNNRLHDGSEVLLNAQKCKADPHCIYREDIYPFMRKPCVLIVDSPASSQFEGMPCEMFGQPFVSLLSPVTVPDIICNENITGRLLTLFLTSPITAMCLLCRFTYTDRPTKSDIRALETATGQTVEILAFIHSKVMHIHHHSEEFGFIRFYSDQVLATLLNRFLLFAITLSMDRRFNLNCNQPRCQPSIPNEVFNDRHIRKSILELCSTLRAHHHFELH
ncbi:hypothetical protein GJ496_004753 [Pomphorhynchus laevis]|nr:hypothetical protein GJ496_004753 [Pomphorhynchus laevis]